MTRSEQAAFARLDKRRHELFVALGIIKTWIQMGVREPEELLYRIADFCHGKIENEKWEAKKEEKRNEKGGKQ